MPPRRPRVEWTEKEEACLLDGVEKYGKLWHVLTTKYPFHPQRTAADLKEKYMRMTKKV